MTEVRIHGYLSKFFNSKIKIHLGKMNDVFRALFAIKAGLREKIIDLQNKGYNYTYIVNKNIIDIIPVIAGLGKAGRWIVAAVLVIVGAVLVVTGVGSALGFALISAGISLALYKDPKLPSFKARTGGAVLNSDRKGSSYIFSNIQNTASQGKLIPIGYGKFLTSSKIINISTKNYSTSQTFSSENILSLQDNIFTLIL
jgi:predicted phage tail protein